MHRAIYIILTFLLLSLSGLAQKITRLDVPFQVVEAKVVYGDTLVLETLPEVMIFGKIPFENKREKRRHDRLVRNVKKVYPYARLAGMKLREYEDVLRAAETDRERRKLMKQAEEELKEEFSDDMTTLNFSQGKILIKLIDRETGDTSYELIEELRGNFMAFFWQTFARIFGYNLKARYEPHGEDKDIENIVLMIESGAI